MFIADVSMEYISFRGVPLFNDGDYMVFVSEIPFHVDEVLQSGELLSVPKKMVKTYKPLFRLHTFERFSILRILDENQQKSWKETIEKMFDGRGSKTASFLRELHIEELLIFVDLWEAGELIVESDVIMHHDEQEGIVSFDITSETSSVTLREFLTHLANETKQREKNAEKTFGQLKERFTCLSGLKR